MYDLFSIFLNTWFPLYFQKKCIVIKFLNHFSKVKYEKRLIFIFKSLIKTSQNFMLQKTYLIYYTSTRQNHTTINNSSCNRLRPCCNLIRTHQINIVKINICISLTKWALSTLALKQPLMGKVEMTLLNHHNSTSLTLSVFQF